MPLPRDNSGRGVVGCFLLWGTTWVMWCAGGVLSSFFVGELGCGARQPRSLLSLSLMLCGGLLGSSLFFLCVLLCQTLLGVGCLLGTKEVGGDS